ncbi:hypothetical protein TNCT_504421 [Trichonephila clavata]|uniref:Uncharacterized protein n=1 Tax=Trichonephila clavata TaxID=2740835 RepID=A0A8X6M017_TRICU|nr:hypothetical protein TNCT_504421 [Trichonephila clavata]
MQLYDLQRVEHHQDTLRVPDMIRRNSPQIPLLFLTIREHLAEIIKHISREQGVSKETAFDTESAISLPIIPTGDGIN